jgi:SOS-response transcriptional repressor LexA
MDQKLRNVLQALADLQQETGLPATIREISARAGYSSGSGVDRHLVALERAGWITREPRVSRSIRITPDGTQELAKP